MLMYPDHLKKLLDFGLGPLIFLIFVMAAASNFLYAKKGVSGTLDGVVLYS